MGFVWVFGWVLVAAVLALLAILWAAMQAMAEGARVLGWALVLIGAGAALLPKLAEGLGGARFWPALSVGMAVLGLAALAALLLLRRIAPTAAGVGLLAVLHAALAVSVFAILSGQAE